jgi:hypothetical protein
VETEEEKIDSNFKIMESFFPQADPEFLHAKAEELHRAIVAADGDLKVFHEFVDNGMETQGKDFPSRKEYEKRRERELVVAKYSKEVTVQDILDMYPDPEEYFGREDRKTTELYRRLSLGHLKREFRQVSAGHIVKTFESNKGLYYPSYKKLRQPMNKTNHKRKTKRSDLEAPLPQEIDINFLKVYSS